MSEIDELNELIIDDLMNITQSPSFNIWFNGFVLKKISDNKMTFATPSNLRQKFLNSRYKEMIEVSVENIMGFKMDVEIISTEEPEEEEVHEPPTFTEEEKQKAKEREEKITEFLRTNEHNKSVISQYTFENFIEGESNKFARAACLAVAMEPTTIYNPLFIYGNSGLGKTHLLYAIINYLKKNHPKLRIVYKKSEDFINELIQAISDRETMEFKERYRKADVLLIDDIQFIAGKEATQEEFFHTFSALYESGKQIILTSDRPPKEIRPLSDRLRTRFEGGLIADVHKPSFELRVAIINKKVDEMNIVMDTEMVNYMAERLQHDIRQIEGALKRIKAFYSITGRYVDKEAIDSVIAVIDPGNIPTDALVEKIIITTAKYYGVTAEDVKSKNKTNNIAFARHIAVYIIKKMTDLSFKAVGSFLGGRDHSTILSSYNKVEEYISTKKNTDSDIKKIMKEVRGG